jgi:transmembrane sensor
MANPAPPTPALAEAVDRFARLRDSTPTTEDLDDLDQWLDASVDHREAYEAVAAHWAEMEMLRSDTALLYMRESARRDLRRTRLGRAMTGGAIAAAAVLAVAGATFLPGAYDAFVKRQAREHAQTFRTAIGEVSERRLADGTVTTLDTNTVLRAWQVKDARFVELVQGRARFKVAKDPARPFSVLARGKSVTATGTDFDVYLKSDSLRVTLVEGRVRVRTQEKGSNLPSIDLTPGYQLTASSSHWALAQTDAASNVSWSQRQLTFDNDTLREIADELNRYSTRKIVINDSRIANLRMSAVIKTSDNLSFLDAVEELSLAHVRKGDNVFELTPR